MAAASSRSPRRWRAPAARRSSSRISPRRAACARSRRKPRSTCSTALPSGAGTGLRRDLCAAGDQQPRSSSPNGTTSSSTSGWRGGAALHVDTGMNRLGLSLEEAAAIATRIAVGKPRHHAADEPPRLRRPAGASAQRSADPAVPRNPLAVPRHSAARSPIPPASSSTRRPIATWCGPASRSTAAIRRRASPIRCGR